MQNSNPREIALPSLIQKLKDIRSHGKEQVCFLIGAGASMSSGIPDAKTLATQWLDDLETLSPKGWDEWKEREQLDPNYLVKHYSSLAHKRFEYSNLNNALETIVDNAVPNVGHALLAGLVRQTSFNRVITANFDFLIEDALRQFTTARPLVLGHSELVTFANTNTARPVIFKVHNDLFLSSKTKTQALTALASNWDKPLNRLLAERALVVIGYGGHDESLQKWLKAIKDSNRKPIFWCYKDERPDFANDVLTANDYLIKINGFEELMYDYARYGIIDSDIIDEAAIVRNAKQSYQQISKQLKKIQDKASKIDSCLSETKSEFLNTMYGEDNWWNIQKKINKLENKKDKTKADVDNIDKMYLHGINQIPTSSELHSNYAVFLKKSKQDYANAERYYLKALELDAHNVNAHSNYALFLRNIKKDYANAERYFLKALELDPSDVNTHSNYALFLKNIKKDYAKAEKYYLKALELSPTLASLNGNYAVFLNDIKKDYDKAEKYYLKALELDPSDVNTHSNYALFLDDIKQDYDNAEKYYLKALDLDPNDVNTHSNYAVFLNDIKQDYKNAEKYYLKALELDANDANVHSNYALFLDDSKKDYDNAEKYYLKAFELDANDVNTHSNYALFLKNIKKDYDKAEKYYLKALELNPNLANINGNYAVFLDDIKRDYANAEKYYLKAVALDSNDVNTHSNYAVFLNDIKQDYDKAEKSYLKALELDESNANTHSNYAGFLQVHNTTLFTKQWQKAFELAQRDNIDELILKLWFYDVCQNFAETNQKARAEINRLLAEGVTSLDFDLTNNIQFAKARGCSNMQELEGFARRINGAE